MLNDFIVRYQILKIVFSFCFMAAASMFWLVSAPPAYSQKPTKKDIAVFSPKKAKLKAMQARGFIKTGLRPVYPADFDCPKVYQVLHLRHGLMAVGEASSIFVVFTGATIFPPTKEHRSWRWPMVLSCTRAVAKESVVLVSFCSTLQMTPVLALGYTLSTNIL